MQAKGDPVMNSSAMVRMFDGRFGRLVLEDLPATASIQAGDDPAIVLARGTGEIRFLNPGEAYASPAATRVAVFHASSAWLRQSFPAVFAAAPARAFASPR